MRFLRNFFKVAKHVRGDTRWRLQQCAWPDDQPPSPTNIRRPPPAVRDRTGTDCTKPYTAQHTNDRFTNTPQDPRGQARAVDFHMSPIPVPYLIGLILAQWSLNGTPKPKRMGKTYHHAPPPPHLSSVPPPPAVSITINRGQWSQSSPGIKDGKNAQLNPMAVFWGTYYKKHKPCENT